MSGRKFSHKIMLGIGLICAMALTYAGTPVWTFTPLTSTTITVAANDTATVSYQVTNQSRKSHTLVMKAIPGVTQVTSTGNCPSPFVLGYQQSCTLNLSINGSALNGNVNGGPVVCSQGNPNQCYQPSAANSLRITKGPAVDYTVGGSVFGLSGTLVLENNGGDALTLNADGTFTFSNALPPGSSYLVTVQSQPATQTCTVTNGSGTITNANITNVTVNCSINTRTVGGSVSGLTASESVVLQNNGSDNLTLNSNGSFTFSTPAAQGATYNVTVLTQPSTQTCTVTNGSGTAGASNITNVQVTCATNAYTVGGTVSGLSGTVVLQDNGSDNLTINSNGSFTFATPVAQGAAYSVIVFTQPSGQTCSVTNGSGTMGGANVTNVGVNCVTNTTTLNTSVSQLALSVTGLTEYGVSGTPSSGLARVITITNTGSNTAVNLAVTPPTWPAGTSSATTCGSTLAASNSCTITITPGATASSDGTNPCSSGTAPVPGAVQVSADNATTVSSDVVVLGYGCVYQGGYVYAFDDTTPNTGSVGGKVATTSDQASAYPNGIVWDSSSGCITSPYNSCYTTNADSATNGTNVSGGNTYLIYQTLTTTHSELANSYAAGLCTATIATYSDWYLPAICEMGYGANFAGINCGIQNSPALQNMQSNLVDNLNLLAGYYWSSTEYSPLPTEVAWYQVFASGGGSGQANLYKGYDPLGVRCSRALTL